MFIDIHAHAYKHPWPGTDGKPLFSTPQQLIDRYAGLGIEKACLLPLVSPEIYLPQSNEEILEMAKKWPDVFIPFCNIDPRAIRNSPDAPLDYILKHYRDQGCRGIGEVMPNLPVLDPLVQNLFRHVQETGLPLIPDFAPRVGGHYGLYDDPGLPQLEKCLQKFPKLKILGHGPPFWAEISRLENPCDRAGYPSYPVKEEGAVPKLMRRYHNLYGDLSAGSGYNALARDPAYAVQFINEFHDRLFFGTDICRPDNKVPLGNFLIQLRENDNISQEVFHEVTRENAVKLLTL